ncbi:YfjI family protein [Streptodolium elevatio]|uniref:YfjI family protein n=1 Tax=Streptodolium elevatio TaxID=3157996 RepID=A0ABV3DDE9_9ACTN
MTSPTPFFPNSSSSPGHRAPAGADAPMPHDGAVFDRAFDGFPPDDLLAAFDPPPVWDEPVPLGQVRTLPEFPVDALPGWVADMVAAVAEETQTPADLAGCTALAALSTAAGGRAVVDVRGGWREPVNLYVAVALPPANRKSAVFARMTGPLLKAEQVMDENAIGAIVEAETTARLAKAAAERAAQKAAGADGGKRDELTAEAVALAQAAESVAVPARPQLVADDATPEAVTSLLAEQRGRLAVLSAEGGIFDIIAGRYSGTPNMEVFLKGHAGDLLKVNRQGRREYIEHPALTMGLAVQPAVLEDIARVKGFEGRGLLARFLYSLPVSLVGRRKILTDPVPEQVADTYARRLGALVLALADWTDPAVLPLTPDANAALVERQEHTERRLADGGLLAHVRNWGGKVDGASVRIAGLLHLAAHEQAWTRPIDADTVQAAGRIGDYFTHHALAVFDLMGADPARDRARSVLDHLRHRKAAVVSKRDLFTGLSRAEFPTTADLDPALALLEDHGWVRAGPGPERRGRGRPPSPRYETHPSLHSPGA